MRTATYDLKGLVLAAHPTARGFGWVLFETPTTPLDWGSVSAKIGRNARLLARFERILARYEPAVFLLEEFEVTSPARRADRIRTLCRTMLHLAACKGAQSGVLSRDTVRRCFSTFGAATRYEIALVIAERIEALNHRLPRYRKPWLSEDPRQSVFDAAALVLTFFALKE